MIKVFGVIKEISLMGFILRTFIVGLIVFFVGRYIPKRAAKQLTVYDFIVVWILGALTVAPLLDGEISFTYIMVPLLTLFFWHYVISYISFKNRKLSYFFNGKPIILIDNGTLIRKNLKKHFINIDLLLSELRIENIFDISEVKYLVLEPNGHFSIIKKELNRPVTTEDINLPAKPTNLPLVIINDGKLFEENLAELGVNKQWLIDNLAIHNIKDIFEVYLATLDNVKNLYVAKKI